MKRILLCLMVALFATGCLFAKNNDEKMNVMSYNIRYDNSGDKDNQWKFRRDFAADLVKFHEADVFGAQEVLNNQLNDLLDRLPEYAYVGVGREDGKLLRPNFVTEHFEWLLRQYGLPHIRFHDLRHSCASLMVMNGVSMKQVQEWLGHSTFSTTADIYAHLDYKSKEGSAGVIAELLEMKK